MHNINSNLVLIKDVESTATHKAENGIGDEGTCAMSDALKNNTALTTLNLWGVSEQQDKIKH